MPVLRTSACVEYVEGADSVAIGTCQVVDAIDDD